MFLSNPRCSLDVYLHFPCSGRLPRGSKGGDYNEGGASTPKSVTGRRLTILSERHMDEISKFSLHLPTTTYSPDSMGNTRYSGDKQGFENSSSNFPPLGKD
ncbi:hypothetical protein CEXT_556391 [Caerostris extrusa]|uniref:Uncharacterized protein n=1 Tax=Caerostris extrusa TaxID=172846 RepID=A0AAV4X247_CAEEX|nr:hypothetical protein CEXT_556391 [Caerostris extrusa]